MYGKRRSNFIPVVPSENPRCTSSSAAEAWKVTLRVLGYCEGVTTLIISARVDECKVASH